MTRKRHTPAEIAEKLRLADRFLQDGRTISDVAAALGVSKMTYHRWRAAERAGLMPDRGEASTEAEVLNGSRGNATGTRQRSQAKSLGQLEAENALLRRALGDLLVEKLKLEERLKFSLAS